VQLPAFTIPAPLGRLVGRLPRTPPALVVACALNLARGRLFPVDALAPLLGRCLRLEVVDAGLRIDLTLTPRGFAAAPPGSAAHVTISASAHDFLALAARTEDPDSLFFNRRLRIEGDTELGLLVKNTLDAIDLSVLAPQRLLRRLRPGH